jgi:hypothetical protein
VDRLTQEKLLPLPQAFAWERFATAERKVTWDGDVSYDGVLYGLPGALALAGKYAQVRERTGVLSVWSGGTQVFEIAVRPHPWAISLGVDLLAAPGAQRAPQQGPAVRQHGGVALLAQVLQQAGRCFDIAEEEGDRARREIPSHALLVFSARLKRLAHVYTTTWLDRFSRIAATLLQRIQIIRPRSGIRPQGHVARSIMGILRVFDMRPGRRMGLALPLPVTTRPSTSGPLETMHICNNSAKIGPTFVAKDQED